MEAIKIVSFNLKHDFALAVRNRWKARRELITQLLSSSDASIIGVQELMPDMKEDLRTRLSGFRIVGQGRTRQLANEHAAILLRADNTTLLYDQTFWLSKHPEKAAAAPISRCFRASARCARYTRTRCSKKSACSTRILTTSAARRGALA